MPWRAMYSGACTTRTWGWLATSGGMTAPPLGTSTHSQSLSV